MCVVARKGDAIAGQIWIEVDHLNGKVSLFSPAPAIALAGNELDRIFECRFADTEPQTVRDRLARELDFDPDIWVVALELRTDDLGIQIVAT